MTQKTLLFASYSAHTLINSLSDLIALLTIYSLDFATYKSAGNFPNKKKNGSDRLIPFLPKNPP